MINPMFNWARFPVAYFVLSMNEVWEAENENEESVAVTFLKLWPNLKKHLLSLPKGRIDAVTVVSPTGEEDLDIDFCNQLWSIDMYLLNTKRFQEAQSFCQDMLDLFDWNADDRAHWIGSIGGCMWHTDPKKAEHYFKEHLKERNDAIMGYYSFELLMDERWDDAAAALRGYEDSTDETIQDRFEWLKRRE